MSPAKHLWFTRGLGRSAFTALDRQTQGETFVWLLRPREGLVVGKVYTDGSLLDSDIRYEGWCAALGWTFVVLDPDGQVVAAAMGCPPAWVESIYGAELWALLKVAEVAMPSGVDVLADCQSVQVDSSRGIKSATAPKRRYARIWSQVQHLTDDGQSPMPVTWMPAHTAIHDVGVLIKSNGEALTSEDRQANAIADRQAKSAAAVRQVQRWLKEKFEREADEVAEMARWLAAVTLQANRFRLDDGTVVRDTTAKAEWRRKRGVKRKRASPNNTNTNPETGVERLLKTPRLAALRQRLLLKA